MFDGDCFNRDVHESCNRSLDSFRAEASGSEDFHHDETIPGIMVVINESDDQRELVKASSWLDASGCNEVTCSWTLVLGPWPLVFFARLFPPLPRDGS